MNILILSCNTGEGHNAAGRAVCERLIHDGHSAVMKDIMLLAGKRTSKIVGGGYVGIVRHSPRVFHAMYKVGGAISSSKRKSPVYFANSLLADKLKDYLSKKSFDAVVLPHLFPAETLTYMKKHGMTNIKTVAVSTDYTCIPFWEETDCDYYILAHEDLTDEYAQKGISRKKLIPLGIPVRMDFSEKKDKAEARKACGLEKDKIIYLIMSGSMGFGNLKKLMNKFHSKCGDGEQIVVICGSNEKMRRSLEQRFKNNKNIIIIGYTDKVSDYMDACDVIFTKPGGLSSTEAAVKNIPVVHLNPIPGCETKNAEFFAERAMSVYAKKADEQVACGRQLALDKLKRDKMITAQKANISKSSAAEIVRFLESLVNGDL